MTSTYPTRSEYLPSPQISAYLPSTSLAPHWRRAFPLGAFSPVALRSKLFPGLLLSPRTQRLCSCLCFHPKLASRVCKRIIFCPPQRQQTRASQSKQSTPRLLTPGAGLDRPAQRFLFPCRFNLKYVFKSLWTGFEFRNALSHLRCHQSDRVLWVGRAKHVAPRRWDQTRDAPGPAAPPPIPRGLQNRVTRNHAGATLHVPSLPINHPHTNL